MTAGFTKKLSQRSILYDHHVDQPLQVDNQMFKAAYAIRFWGVLAD